VYGFSVLFTVFPFITRRSFPEQETLYLTLGLEQSAFIPYDELQELGAFLEIESQDEPDIRLHLVATRRSEEEGMISYRVTVEDLSGFTIEDIRQGLEAEEVYVQVDRSYSQELDFGDRALTEEEITRVIEWIQFDGSDSDVFGGVTYMEIKGVRADPGMYERLQKVCGEEDSSFGLEVDWEKLYNDTQGCTLERVPARLFGV
jgi:hypothetical protein